MDLGDIVGLAPILTSSFTVESINVPDLEYEAPWEGTAEDGVWYYIYDVGIAAERISSFIYEEDSPIGVSTAILLSAEHLAAVKNNVCQVSAAEEERQNCNGKVKNIGRLK